MPRRVYASRMIVDIQGDLFRTAAPAIAHGCNTQALMGAGVAAIVRRDYPEVYIEYAEACRESDFKPGQMLPAWGTNPHTDKPVWILNLASQDLPGPHARADWLEGSLRDALAFCHESGFCRMAAPRIGAGIGGLDWETEVRPVFEKVADEFPTITVEVYFL